MSAKGPSLASESDIPIDPKPIKALNLQGYIPKPLTLNPEKP